MSRIAILGARGRMGAAFARQWAHQHEVTALARPELDLSDLAALERLVKSLDYDILVNAAASTNVDRCETERDEATTVNATAVGLLARLAAERDARLIHISTDYVFDGEKDTPYVESDEARPLGHYGQTKLDGERLALAASPRHVVARVSWVFGPDKPSFVDMIVDRALKNPRVEAIGDKTSSPTSAEDSAEWLAAFFDPATPGGLYHACNSGSCTWQEYGQHALDCALQAGAPIQARTVEPIPLASMKAFVAPRPRQTALHTGKLTSVLGRPPRSWQDAVADFIQRKFR